MLANILICMFMTGLHHIDGQLSKYCQTRFAVLTCWIFVSLYLRCYLHWLIKLRSQFLWRMINLVSKQKIARSILHRVQWNNSVNGTCYIVHNQLKILTNLNWYFFMANFFCGQWALPLNWHKPTSNKSEYLLQLSTSIYSVLFIG